MGNKRGMFFKNGGNNCSSLDGGNSNREITNPACPSAGECPTSCGYEGGTVPDGNGGSISCSATEACPSDEEDNNDKPIKRTGSRRTGSYVGVRSTGQVLGAEASCGIYVEKYLKKGLKGNDSEAVKKVQTFLNNYMNAGLTVDGVFGNKTFVALNNFQTKHADKILVPWGLVKPTGIFYLTTQTEVNNIMCPELNLPIPTNLVNFSQNPLTPKF